MPSPPLSPEKLAEAQALVQWVDDPQGRRGSSATGSIEQAVRHVQVGPVPERLDPIVDGLAAHKKEVSDRRDRPPVVEPQQDLGAPQLRGIMRLIQELQQSASFPRVELEWSHKPPPADQRCKGHSFCQRTFILLLRITEPTLLKEAV